MFTIIKKDIDSLARVGALETSHGTVETPAYTIVGTHANVRCLTPTDISAARTQMVIANTYHLWLTLGEKLATFEGVHTRLGWQGPMMTDSGGFQVFSLGFSREHGVGKVASIFPGEAANVGRTDKNLVRITEEGAWFTSDDGVKRFLDAKTSIAIQEKLGADIILAFDECTSPLHSVVYTKNALARTHRWADESLAAKTRSDQFLYGIVQGGAYEALRKESARYIGARHFDGFAIGGSFGGSFGDSRANMLSVLEWSVPFLPEEKPRHLLGIGKIEDLFDGVARGIDTFDCVIPTREARHGALWTARGRYDIKKMKWRGNSEPLEKGCECPACGLWCMTKGELAERFSAKDTDAARIATMHNVYFFNMLMTRIRESIRNRRFSEFKNEFMSGYRDKES